MQSVKLPAGSKKICFLLEEMLFTHWWFHSLLSLNSINIFFLCLDLCISFNSDCISVAQSNPYWRTLIKVLQPFTFKVLLSFLFFFYMKWFLFKSAFSLCSLGLKWVGSCCLKWWCQRFFSHQSERNKESKNPGLISLLLHVYFVFSSLI